MPSPTSPFFQDLKPLQHPLREEALLFSTVERYRHWYYCRGQDRKAGIHTTGMEWRFFTKDKDIAIKTARSHIE